MVKKIGKNSCEDKFFTAFVDKSLVDQFIESRPKEAMAFNFDDEIVKLDQLIRKGQSASALKRIAEIRKRHKVPRQHLAKLANLCRRCGRPEQALLLLHSYVRPKEGMTFEPTPTELAEYACALIKVGAVHEGITLLKNCHKNDALLYQAFGHIQCWENPQAMSLLIQYIASPETTDYQRLVGQVNLASTFIKMGQFTNAYDLLGEVREIVLSKNLDLLLANIFQLSAEVAIDLGNYEEAETFIQKSRDKTRAISSAERLMINRWYHVLHLSQNKNSSEHLLGLKGTLIEAQQLGLFELARSCEYYVGKLTQDKNLFLKLYCGTPALGFRSMIKKDYDFQALIPETYQWQINDKIPSLKIFDMKVSRETTGPVELKPGQIQYRMLLALTHDFYAPQSVATCHELIFPGEYYNPHTSPMKVFEALKRLRQWLKQENIPLEIDRSENFINLNPQKSSYAFNVSVERADLGSSEIYFNRVGAQLAHTAFNSFELSQLISLSKRTCVNILNDWIQLGLVQKIGSKASTKYTLINNVIIPKKAA